MELCALVWWNEHITNAQAASCVKDRLCHWAAGEPFQSWKLPQKARWLRPLTSWLVHFPGFLWVKLFQIHEVVWPPLVRSGPSIFSPSSPQINRTPGNEDPRPTRSGLVIASVVGYCGYVWRCSRLGRLVAQPVWTLSWRQNLLFTQWTKGFPGFLALLLWHRVIEPKALKGILPPICIIFIKICYIILPKSNFTDWI